jgi:DNA polymerase-1
VDKQKAISFKLNIENGKIKNVVLFSDDKENILLFSKNFKKIKKVFEDKKVLKCGYNLKEAIKNFRAEGIEISEPIFDCFVAPYLINPGMREYKEEEKTETILETARGLWKEMNQTGLLKLFQEIEMPLMFVLAKIEENGVKINTEYLNKMSAMFDKKIIKLKKEIWKQAGEEFNINSPAQIKKILFEKIKISSKGVRKTSKKSELSTAASELERLREAHPIINFILEYRELYKLKSTYIDALPELADKKTKRIHANFNQTITSTGRLSSSNPNLQNIPARGELGREIRKAFIAEKGKILLAFDYSQIELRIIASLSGDEKMIAAFNSREDIHTRTASEVWGVPQSEVTKDMRRAAKAINFGVIYGIGPRSLAESAGISYNEAVDFISRYFSLYQGVKNYLEETKALAYSLGYSETLFGRRRYFPEIISPIPYLRAAAERMAINHPVQGTAADIIKIAMIKINEELPDVKMILQVHDELVFEIKKTNFKKTAMQIKELMENAVKLKVPVEADAKIGENWGDMKKL